MTLNLEPKEVQYLVNLAGAVPSGQALEAGMTGLLPKLLEQANAQAQQPAAA